MARCVDKSLDFTKADEEKLEKELEETELEIHESEPEMKGNHCTSFDCLKLVNL